MKHFTYRSQENDIDAVLSYRKNRIFRQQLIFSAFFGLLLFLLALWAYHRVRYAEFDGHVRLNINLIRMIDDIYLVDFNCRPGDHVNEGDTLFRYVFVNQILERVNVNRMTTHESDLRDYDIRSRLVGEQIGVLSSKITALREQIASERRRIAFGGATVERVEGLERELNGMETELAALGEQRSLYGRYASAAAEGMDRSGIASGLPSLYTLSYIREHFDDYRGVRSYYLAQTDALVTDIERTVGSVVFKKENVMTTQSDDDQITDLHVMAYVPAEDMRYVREGGKVEVIVNNDLIYHGCITKAGLMVVELPKHLQNSFTNHIEVVGVRIDFDPGQDIPSWVRSDRLPARIRIDKLRRRGDVQPVETNRE